MRLVLMRHGVAEDRERFAERSTDDALRPLTKEGRWKMERNARGLRRAVSALDVLAASPLRRAEQTARIIADAYHGMEVVTVPALAPDAPVDDVLAWLRRQRASATVAVVGHDPQVGVLATWLLTGERREQVTFRKGGACLIEFEGRPAAGAGQLAWALTPALLRRLS